MKKYDVFISYRDRDKKVWAKDIYNILKNRGYHVVLNEDALSIEDVKESQYSVIEACQDVIVILSPDTLDQCIDEDDRMRLEIAHALQCDKNIIYVTFGEFPSPSGLPEDIEKDQCQKEIRASVESLDTSIRELYGSMRSRPSIIRRIYNNVSWIRAFIAIICCLSVLLGVWGGALMLHQKTEVTGYPITQKQKNDVDEFLYYSQINIRIMDNIFFAFYELIEACEEYLQEMSPKTYNDLILQIEHCRKILNQQGKQIQKLSSEQKTALADTKINVLELTALSQLPEIIVMKYNNNLNSLEFVMEPNKSFSMDVRQRIVTINKKLIQLDADSILIGTCGLLLPIDREALIDFETEFLPSLLMLSNGLQLWGAEEIELRSEMKKVLTQQQELLKEYAKLTVRDHKNFLTRKESLILQLIEAGMTREEADYYIDSRLEKYQPFINPQQE